MLNNFQSQQVGKVFLKSTERTFSSEKLNLIPSSAKVSFTLQRRQQSNV